MLQTPIDFTRNNIESLVQDKIKCNIFFEKYLCTIDFNFRRLEMSYNFHDFEPQAKIMQFKYLPRLKLLIT